MYNIPYFKEKDKKVILEFIERFPFAFVTGVDAVNRPVATQVPVMVEERDGELFLQAHIMRQTDHHKAFMQNNDVLVVFTGPNTYVSATWYTDPRGGSTWNFMSVYLRGKMRFMDDSGLRQLMKKLTLRFEKGDTSSPTIFDNLPDEYISHMLPGIVGFEIKVEEVQNVFKLSQNRNEPSYLNIIDKLEEQGGDGALIAEEMRKRKSELFPEEEKKN